MGLLNIDLGDTDQTINANTPGYEDGQTNTISLTAIGEHTLTADGVDATINQFAGISGLSAPTYAAINGAHLTVDYGAVNLSLLNSVTYSVGNDSSISVSPSTFSAAVNFPTNIVFDSGGGTGTFNWDVNPLTSVDLDIHGLEAGDSLSVNGQDIGSFEYNENTGVGTLHFGNLFSGQVNYAIHDMDPELAALIEANPEEYFQNGSFVMPVCFLRGTMVLTPEGEVVVQDLKAGDKVIGSSGVREVKWVGYRKTIIHTIAPEQRAKHLPIRICRNAIANLVPAKDIVVSPGHHVLIDGKLVRATDIQNGKTIYQETHHISFHYYHVELDQFDVISAHGLFSESWADGGNRDYFSNVDVAALHPEDRQRRRAERPGFVALRKSKELTRIKAQLESRAEQLAALSEHALAA
jgi:hypothetical protein